MFKVRFFSVFLPKVLYMNRLSIKYIFFILVFATACNNEVTNQLEPKNAALGKMNEIVVIADQDLWESSVGDTFRYYFESAYPILPAPEPLFDVRHFTTIELETEPLRKELRTYVILADLKDEDSPTSRMVKKDIGSERYRSALESNELTSSVGKDKWARGQILFYLFGSNYDNIHDAIKKHFPAIARRVNEHDEKQLKSSIYVDRINMGLTERLKSDFGLELEVPGEYQIVTNDEEADLLWLRKDTPEAILNIVVQSIPYNNQDQLNKENIIALRNDFGQNYITSDEEGDVMIVNDRDLPVYEYTFELDGKYTKELRGVWEMTKAFAGGPFITYVVVDEKSKRLIYIDTFILAPGSEKRDMMMQLDYIVKSGKLNTISDL